MDNLDKNNFMERETSFINRSTLERPNIMKKKKLNKTSFNVSLTNVEKELNTLWESDKSIKKIKASLFNLVIYKNVDSQDSYMQNILNKLTNQFPCRVLLINNHGKKNQDLLQTSVSVKSLNELDSSITCDHINIEVGEDHLEKVPFIVLPHLVPDLPVYLWWENNPLSDDIIIPHLETFANSVIYDSICSDHLEDFCKSLLKSQTSWTSNLIDMRWILISNWRQVISLVFDSKEQVQSLSSAKSITIKYNQLSTEEESREVLYLTAWLSSCLSWNFLSKNKQDNSKTSFNYNYNKEETSISLVTDQNPLQPHGKVLSIEVCGKNGEHYLLTLQDFEPLVKVETSSPERCELPNFLHFAQADKVQTIMNDVFYSPTSKHYIETIKMLLKLETPL